MARSLPELSNLEGPGIFFLGDRAYSPGFALFFPERLQTRENPCTMEAETAADPRWGKENCNGEDS